MEWCYFVYRTASDAVSTGYESTAIRSYIFQWQTIVTYHKSIPVGGASQEIKTDWMKSALSVVLFITVFIATVYYLAASGRENNKDEVLLDAIKKTDC